LKLYESNIGPIAGGFIGEEIEEALKEYPFEWFEPAFRLAVTSNVRSWRYVIGILKNWKLHGFMADNRPAKSQPRGTSPRSGSTNPNAQANREALAAKAAREQTRLLEKAEDTGDEIYL